MAGIYVHIPFCKSRCIYCDFFSTTFLNKQDKYICAVNRELQERRNYLNDEIVSTIYFGGGTPSLLSKESINSILKTISANFCISKDAEITLEANPNDLSLPKLKELNNIGINRLSIGIQSFNDDLLHLIGRRHNAQEAIESVKAAQQTGFNNISVDLMYALPRQTVEVWQQTIDKALDLNVQHISTYCLTAEEGTRLWNMLQTKELTETDEDTANLMYEMVANKLQQAGYEHYEVSNFSLPDFHSRHNCSYWNGTKYLGVGAGAHSYNGASRQWNINDIDAYINKTQPTIEKLTSQDIYNEHILLGLRTKNGVNLNCMSQEERVYCLKQAQNYIHCNMLKVDNNRLAVSSIKATELLNRIIVDLMK